MRCPLCGAKPRMWSLNPTSPDSPTMTSNAPPTWFASANLPCGRHCRKCASGWRLRRKRLILGPNVVPCRARRPCPRTERSLTPLPWLFLPQPLTPSRILLDEDKHEGSIYCLVRLVIREDRHGKISQEAQSRNPIDHGLRPESRRRILADPECQGPVQ